MPLGSCPLSSAFIHRGEVETNLKAHTSLVFSRFSPVVQTPSPVVHHGTERVEGSPAKSSASLAAETGVRSWMIFGPSSGLLGGLHATRSGARAAALCDPTSSVSTSPVASVSPEGAPSNGSRYVATVSRP